MSCYKIHEELNHIMEKYEEMGLLSRLYFSEKEMEIEIGSLYIEDVSKRRKGLGGEIMGEIVDLADRYGLDCTINPIDGETPINVLKEFYRGFGFKEGLDGMFRQSEFAG